MNSSFSSASKVPQQEEPCLGPLMIDIEGLCLSALDRERLVHPLVGGVILFARNYQDPEQLQALTAELHALRAPPLLIAIDHEGGRVQRCRTGFTRLPAMRQLGVLWAQEPLRAQTVAADLGYVLAAELRARGVDFSFTPVLDLDWGRSEVIGDRAFARDPAVVIDLARAFISGLHQAGMASCGKHFPGHGWVEADSHVAIPVDERALTELAPDLLPYRSLALDAVMPAHVIYPQIDAQPAGFSALWLTMLRQDFAFDGVIFSDDLSMAGAAVAGDIVQRADAAWQAGCDMLLVCNAPEDVATLFARWQAQPDPVRASRVARLRPQSPPSAWSALQQEARYLAGVRAALALQ
ncbi:MAG: beta-N-acetylhexosaminidase [Pseudomonadota bacterium]